MIGEGNFAFACQVIFPFRQSEQASNGNEQSVAKKQFVFWQVLMPDQFYNCETCFKFITNCAWFLIYHAQ